MCMASFGIKKRIDVLCICAIVELFEQCKIPAGIEGVSSWDFNQGLLDLNK